MYIAYLDYILSACGSKQTLDLWVLCCSSLDLTRQVSWHVFPVMWQVLINIKSKYFIIFVFNFLPVMAS